MKWYDCQSKYKENFLIENGCVPLMYQGETAVFEYNEKLQSLLDLYWIKIKIFKEK